MTAATGKPPEGEKKGKDKEKKDLPPCKVLVLSQKKSLVCIKTCARWWSEGFLLLWQLSNS